MRNPTVNRIEARLKADGTPRAPEARSFGLVEFFTSPDRGCAGAITLSLEPRWQEKWQKPVMTWIWDAHVQHRQECRRRGG